MVIYLDASALVKLFVVEAGAARVRSLVASARVASTCAVAYAETRSALARLHRDGLHDEDHHRIAVGSLDARWGAFPLVPLTDTVIRLAGGFTDKHALRGFDALHLACAVHLKGLLRSPPRFCCFDERLARAAVAEGLPA